MTLGVLAWRSAAFETLVLKLAAEVATFAASNAVCLRLYEEEEGFACFLDFNVEPDRLRALSLVAVALAAVVGDMVATSCVLCRLSGGPRSVSPHTANACTACRLGLV